MGNRLPQVDLRFRMKQNELAKQATNIWTMMGNAEGLVNFPEPPVPLVDLVAAINAYTASLATAVKGSKEDTQNKNNARSALVVILRSLGIYVSQKAQAQVSDGPPTQFQIASIARLVLSSGFLIAKTPRPVGNSGGVKLPIVKKAISLSPGVLHILLKQYTRFKKGTKVWQLQYRVPATGSTPAGPWITQVFTSGRIYAEGIAPGITEWQIAAIGGHNTKLNARNPVNFTPVQRVVVT